MAKKRFFLAEGRDKLKTWQRIAAKLNWESMDSLILDNKGPGVMAFNQRKFILIHKDHRMNFQKAIKNGSSLCKKIQRLNDSPVRDRISFLSRKYGPNTSMKDAIHRLSMDVYQELYGVPFVIEEKAPPPLTEEELFLQFLESLDSEEEEPPEEPPEESPEESPEEESSSEERKKETDEVNGESQTGDDSHGGDSSSGEVPDGKSGYKSLKKDSRDLERKRKNDIRSQDHRRKKKAKAGKPGKGTGEGGVEDLGAPPDPAIVQRARKALSGLTGSSSIEMGPRVDPKEFCERLLTKRPISQAKKEESGRPAILIIADVSGSCSKFARPATKVAKACGALGIQGADIVIVSCYNPFRVENIEINGERVWTLFSSQEKMDSVNDFMEFMKQKGITIEGVIGIGDDDEHDTYLEFCEKTNWVIQLDNYKCSYLKRPRLVKNSALPKNMHIFDGCRNEESMLYALERAVRRVGG